jgi:putative membrane protein
LRNKVSLTESPLFEFYTIARRVSRLLFLQAFANSATQLALAISTCQAQTMDYPGWDGFLGTRASFMLDAVCVAMVAVMVVLAWSIRQVRVHRNFQLHKRVQLALAALLAVVLVAFELDVRINGWQERAAGAIGGEPGRAVFAALVIHLLFALTTVALWTIVIVRALRRFPNPPVPNEHSRFHRRFGWLAAIDMLCTTITGWIFYFLAFVM